MKVEQQQPCSSVRVGDIKFYKNRFAINLITHNNTTTPNHPSPSTLSSKKMAGHSAWKKRVAEGRLAKEGTGGAIARHRPRFGRMGLVRPNKKSSSTNPKKQSNNSGRRKPTTPTAVATGSTSSSPPPPQQNTTMWTPQQIEHAKKIIWKWGFVTVSGIIYLLMKHYYKSQHGDGGEEKFPDL
jgi:hypothetical protein